MSKHNTADVLSKQPNYASEIKENSCLPILQSKLKAMKTVTPKLFKLIKEKLNKVNYIKCMSDVSALMGHKPTIRDKFKMDWHKLPESPIREPNEVDHAGSITTLAGHKLII